MTDRTKTTLLTLKLSLLAFLPLLFATFASNAFASIPTSSSRFTVLLPDDGLTTGAAQAILQDSEGFMWFGGQDGLARYDGYEFEHFTHSDSDDSTISHNAVWDIVEDDNNQLWIATDSGIDLFDRDTNTFTNFAMSSHQETLVRHIAIGQSGNLWLGTPIGLVQFNIETKTFTHVGLTSEGKYVQSLVLHLSIDSQGVIWISTDGAGLFSYNPLTTSFQHFEQDAEDPNSIGHNVVWMAYELSDGNVWAATDVDISILNRQDNKFSHHRYKKNDPTTIAGPTVTSLLEDSSGFLWAGTNLGLSVYDFSTQKFTRIVNDPQDSRSISSNIIRQIYQDRNDDVWIGTFPEGVSFFNRGDMPFATKKHKTDDPTTVNTNAILSFLEDSKGRFWVGTDGGGVNRFDPGNPRPIIYEPDESRVYEPSLISGNAILDLAEDPDGTIWIGHWGRGISRLHPETGQIKHYKLDYETPNALRSGNIWILFFDKQDNLWIGSIGGGLYRYNRADDNFINYSHDPSDPKTAGSMIIWTIMQERDGTLWIGTDDGLDQFDATTNTFIHYRRSPDSDNSLSQNVVLTIHESKDGMLWIGTRGGGLNKFDKTISKFTRYGKQHGLPSEVINSIEEDGMGNLWLGTNKGLVRFSPDEEKFRTYNKSNGLQGDNFNINTSIKLKNGNLVFGGTKGFTEFNPDNIVDNAYLPPVAFRELKILNESVNLHDEKSPLSKTINQTDRLTLDYNQYVVTFTFAGLSFRNPEKNQYAYRLDPFDKKWNQVGTQRTATYTNLDAGDYVL